MNPGSSDTPRTPIFLDNSPWWRPQEPWTVVCCHLVAGMGTVCSISILDNLNQENAEYLPVFHVPSKILRTWGR